MMWNGPLGFADGWGVFWPFHLIIPLLFFAAIIAVVVLLVRYLAGWRGGYDPDRPDMP